MNEVDLFFDGLPEDSSIETISNFFQFPQIDVSGKRFEKTRRNFHQKSMIFKKWITNLSVRKKMLGEIEIIYNLKKVDEFGTLNQNDRIKIVDYYWKNIVEYLNSAIIYEASKLKIEDQFYVMDFFQNFLNNLTSEVDYLGNPLLNYCYSNSELEELANDYFPVFPLTLFIENLHNLTLKVSDLSKKDKNSIQYFSLFKFFEIFFKEKMNERILDTDNPSISYVVNRFLIYTEAESLGISHFSYESMETIVRGSKISGSMIYLS